MGFSHGRRKIAAKRVKASGLAGVKPVVKFEPGSWYTPIPHGEVLDALQRVVTGAEYGASINSVKGVTLYDGGTTMVAKLILDDDRTPEVCVRPTITVVSSHDGRQPLEAFFGYDVRATPGGVWSGLITSDHTVQQRHSRHADLDEWAGKVLAAFARGWTGKARNAVMRWAESLAAAKMTDPAMYFAVVTSAAARSKSQWRTSIGPFMATDAKRIQELFESDDRGGWPKQSKAAFLHLASKLIDLDERPIRAVWRRRALLLPDCGLDRPSDVYAD